MDLSTEIISEKNIFVIRIKGEYHRPLDGFIAQRMIVDTYPEHQCRRILIDMTKADIHAGILQTYETAKSKPDMIHDLRKFQFALLYSRISEEERFFESTAINRGATICVFDDRKAAIKWLEQH